MAFSYSFDEENFTGEFKTAEDAAAEAFEEDDEASECFVGENCTPVPENFIRADRVLEIITNQDEFCGEWAEDWPGETKGQRDELTAALRKTFGEWLDKHKLRPTFYNVENVKRVEKPEPSI